MDSTELISMLISILVGCFWVLAAFCVYVITFSLVSTFFISMGIIILFLLVAEYATTEKS